MTSQELIKYSEDKRQDFIDFEKQVLIDSILDAAYKQKNYVVVDYIPLLEDYYKEICGEGITYTLDGFKLTIQW